MNYYPPKSPVTVKRRDSQIYTKQYDNRRTKTVLCVLHYVYFLFLSKVSFLTTIAKILAVSKGFNWVLKTFVKYFLTRE